MHDCRLGYPCSGGARCCREGVSQLVHTTLLGRHAVEWPWLLLPVWRAAPIFCFLTSVLSDALVLNPRGAPGAPGGLIKSLLAELPSSCLCLLDPCMRKLFEL